MCDSSQFKVHMIVFLQVSSTLCTKDKREQWGFRSSLSPPPSTSRPSTPTPPPHPCSPTPLSRTCSPLSLSRTSSPLPPPLPVLGTTPAPGPPPPPPLPPTPLLPPPPPGPSRIRESPGDEDTTALLPRCTTLLQLSEDAGTENPLLTPLLSCPSPRLSPLPLSPVDLDLDESHVWDRIYFWPLKMCHNISFYCTFKQRVKSSPPSSSSSYISYCWMYTGHPIPHHNSTPMLKKYLFFISK